MSFVPKITYKNIEFGSHLKMEWAMFFDRHNIKYLYKMKTFHLPSFRFTPDFYLVDYDVYFDCKGELRSTSRAKIEQLSKKINKPVYVGYANGNFNFCIWIEKNEFYFENPCFSRLELNEKFYGDDDNLKDIRTDKRKENLKKYETRVYEN